MMSDGYVFKSALTPGLGHVWPKPRADTATEVKGQIAELKQWLSDLQSLIYHLKSLLHHPKWQKWSGSSSVRCSPKTNVDRVQKTAIRSIANGGQAHNNFESEQKLRRKNSGQET